MCGSTSDGKLSCCAPGGSWHKKCGSPPKLYTWLQGTQTCKSETTDTRIIFPYTIIWPKSICQSGRERAGWTILRHIFHPHQESQTCMWHHFLNTTPLVCAHYVFGFELTRFNLAQQLLTTCMRVITIVQVQRQQQRQGGHRVGTHG